MLKAQLSSFNPNTLARFQQQRKISQFKKRTFRAQHMNTFTASDHSALHCRCPIYRGVTRGEQGGHNSPSAESLWRAPKSPNNIKSNFFNTVQLLPKDLRFKHGVADLASWPGRHLTSLRPCLYMKTTQKIRARPLHLLGSSWQRLVAVLDRACQEDGWCARSCWDRSRSPGRWRKPA